MPQELADVAYLVARWPAVRGSAKNRWRVDVPQAVDSPPDYVLTVLGLAYAFTATVPGDDEEAIRDGLLQAIDPMPATFTAIASAAVSIEIVGTTPGIELGVEVSPSPGVTIAATETATVDITAHLQVQLDDAAEIIDRSGACWGCKLKQAHAALAAALALAPGRGFREPDDVANDGSGSAAGAVASMSLGSASISFASTAGAVVGKGGVRPADAWLLDSGAGKYYLWLRNGLASTRLPGVALPGIGLNGALVW